MYGIKVTGPYSDEWPGWAIRRGVDANFSVRVRVSGRLHNAEKFHTLDEAVEVAFLLVTQQPHLMCRVKIMKLRRAELDHRWIVEAECTP